MRTDSFECSNVDYAYQRTLDLIFREETQLVTVRNLPHEKADEFCTKLSNTKGLLIASRIPSPRNCEHEDVSVQSAPEQPARKRNKIKPIDLRRIQTLKGNSPYGVA